MDFFIEDGSNLPGYLKADPKLHYPALRFVYRPCLADERQAYWDFETKQERAAATDTGEKMRRKRALVLKHLVSWEVTDRDGNAVAPSDEMLRRLHPNLFDPMFNIIIGVMASDEDEDTVADKRTGPEREAEESKNLRLASG